MYIRQPGYRDLGEPVVRFQGPPSTGSPQGSAQAAVALQPGDWKDLISFVPPASVQKIVFGKRSIFPPTPAWFFHRIEDGVGPANLDYYPVQVTRLPKVQGVTLTPSAFLAHIRRNINDFIDQRLVRFRPRDTVDQHLWNSQAPQGALLHLKFLKVLGPLGSLNIDEGTVVVSDSAPNYWRVYTIWTPTDHGHPVSGVREWGYKPEGSGWVFYTRAADRLTKSVLLPFKGDVYAAQHALWMSFQRGIETFARANGGEATLLPPVANRYDWTTLSAQYHRPTGPWLAP